MEVYDMDPVLVTVEEAARALGIGRTKLYELMKTEAETLPVVRIGRAVRIHVDDVRRLAAALRGPDSGRAA
jgi:excisionase family DNA binding protein